MIDRVSVELAEIFRSGICIRERLEVDDKFMRIESLADVFDAFADLIADGICFDCGRWPKRIVIAVGASADGNGAVPIGAGEARVNNNFVNALAEFFLEPFVIRAEPSLSAWKRVAHLWRAR